MIIILALILTVWAIYRVYLRKPKQAPEILSPAEIERRAKEREREEAKFRAIFNKLEGLCYSRRKNKLTPTQETALENKIKNTVFSVEQYLREVPQDRAQQYCSELSDMLKSYDYDLQEMWG